MTHKPAARNSAFFWNDGTPSVIGASMVPKSHDRGAEAKLQREALATLAEQQPKPTPKPREAISRPAFITVANAVGIKHGRPPKLYTTPGLVKPSSTSLPVVGAEQGRQDANRRDALKRGGI